MELVAIGKNPVVNPEMPLPVVAHAPSPRRNVLLEQDPDHNAYTSDEMAVLMAPVVVVFLTIPVPSVAQFWFEVPSVCVAVFATPDPPPPGVSGVVSAEVKLAPEGVASHVAMPVPNPVMPAIGRRVALVRTNAVGIPSAGVTSVGEVARTIFPLPVVAISPRTPELLNSTDPLVPPEIVVAPTVMAGPPAGPIGPCGPAPPVELMLQYALETLEERVTVSVAMGVALV